MFEYNEKTSFTYSIQSILNSKIHQHYLSKQLWVNTNWAIYHCWLFFIWVNEKMHDFQGYFSKTFRDLKL